MLLVCCLCVFVCLSGRHTSLNTPVCRFGVCVVAKTKAVDLQSFRIWNTKLVVCLTLNNIFAFYDVAWKLLISKKVHIRVSNLVGNFYWWTVRKKFLTFITRRVCKINWNRATIEEKKLPIFFHFRKIMSKIKCKNKFDGRFWKQFWLISKGGTFIPYSTCLWKRLNSVIPWLTPKQNFKLQVGSILTQVLIPTY